MIFFLDHFPRECIDASSLAYFAAVGDVPSSARNSAHTFYCVVLSLYLSHSGEVNTDANLLCMSWGTNIRSNEYRAIEHVRVSIPTLLDGYQVSDWETMAPQLHMYPCFMWSLLPIGLLKMSLPVLFSPYPFSLLLPVECYTGRS